MRSKTMNVIVNWLDYHFRIVVFNVLLIITFGMSGAVYAQEKHKKKRLYKAWVKKTNRKTRLVGTLYQVEDNKLVIASRFKLNHYNLNQFDYQDVYAHEIEKIKLRRKGELGRGVLIGVVSGLLTGAIVLGHKYITY